MISEYITLSRSNGTTKTGSAYCTLKLANLQEIINIAVWDCQPNMGPQMGQLVTFYEIQDKAGKKSANAKDMRAGKFPEETHPLYRLLPRPTKREDWDACIEHLLSFCQDQSVMNVIREYAARLYEPYSKWPAATAMHHAYQGGLVTHTYQMLHILEGLYPCLPYAIKIERCILAIIFHDYGKLREYNQQGETQEDMYLLGHIYMSAFTLQHVLEEAQIDKEEQKAIIHCVLAHHGDREYGSPVVPCLQEAVIVNLIDNISAKTDAIDGTGNMEYCSALGTHVLKK